MSAPPSATALAAELLAIQDRLARAADRLRFAPPVTHVYNPLVYARAGAAAYVARFARPGVDTLLLGMNPGPFGMAQTGVPFGAVGPARGWLGIDAPVGRPAREHPKRPVLGLECPRNEVSGERLWGFAAARFLTPDRFFARFFVWNYCPLAFLEESGRNRTPDHLAPAERAALYLVCDRALAAMVDVLRPRAVVGVGAFAAARARAALAGRTLVIGSILHPSPASPLANRGWAERAERELAALGCLPRVRRR